MTESERIARIETDVVWIRKWLETRDCKDCEAFQSVSGNRVYRKITWANLMAWLTLVGYMVQDYVTRK